MRPLEMDVYMDSVTVEKTVVLRPERITRSVWMRIWEAIVHQRCPWCGHELD